MSKSRRSNYDGLHDIKGLPPLRWQRKESRIALDTDRAAASLFQLKGLLLTSEARNLLRSLARINSHLDPIAHPSEPQTASISSLIHNVFRATQPDFAVREGSRSRYVQIKDTFTRDYERDLRSFLRWNEDVWSDFATAHAKGSGSLNELRRGLNQQLLDATTRLSKKLQDEVADFEEKHNVDLSVLEISPLFVCPDCKAILSYGRLRQSECKHCGNMATKPSEAEQIAVATLSKSILGVIDNNIWLEEGIGWAFRREQFDVFVAYSLMGGSGVWHEIDVVAEKRKAKSRVLAECKSRAVGTGDVFILAGKMRDIGVSSGILCSTEAETNSEVTRLGKTSGIIVGYAMLDKPREFWQSLLEKAT